MIARVPNVLAAVREVRFSAPFEHMDLKEVHDLEKSPRCSHSFTRPSSACSVDSLIKDSNAFSIDSPISDENLHVSEEKDGALMRKREDAEYMDEFFKSEYGDYGRMKLAANITRLLSALPDNQLISFR